MLPGRDWTSLRAGMFLREEPDPTAGDGWTVIGCTATVLEALQHNSV